MLLHVFILAAITSLCVAKTHPAAISSNCLDRYLRANGFDGSIDFPNSSSYSQAIDIDNRRAIQYPLLVVAPMSEADISLSVLAAQVCNTSFSVLSGGHSANGYCLARGGLTVDLSRYIKSVYMVSQGERDAEFYVEAGALWEDIYKAAYESRYVPIGGGCPTVGAGGFLLGGGWSFLSRSYGLACDNIVSMRVVLSNGSAVTASAEQNPELFWGSKGGGGGNFGVVSSFIIKAPKPRSQVMWIGELCWPPFDQPTVEQLWVWWLDYWPRMPTWMDIVPVWLLMEGQSNEEEQRMFCFTVVCNGDPESECQPIIDPLVARYPPETNSVAATGFIPWQLANVDVTDAQGGYLYLTSGILLPGAMTSSLAARLTSALQHAPSKRNLILFHVGGGRIAEFPPNATAFPHRDVQLLIQIKGIWENPDEEAENVAWVKHVRSIIEPYLSGSYLNYIDGLLEDWQQAYYGVNYDRLVTLKRDIDPSNFFSFQQSIDT